MQRNSEVGYMIWEDEDNFEFFTHNIDSYAEYKSTLWALKRAGNPKAIGISLEIPKSLPHLRGAESGSGHDTFLKGIPVQMDIWANKVEREQLLRYGHVHVVSSCSLMHKYSELIGVDRCWEDVNEDVRAWHRERFSDATTEVGVMHLPLGFKYPLSIITNALQLKTIKGQRLGHKLHFWREFIQHIDALDSYITHQYKKESGK